MGYNLKLTLFENTIIPLYERGLLNPMLLDNIGNCFRGSSVWYENIENEKLYEICVQILDPDFKEVLPVDYPAWWAEWDDIKHINYKKRFQQIAKEYWQWW